MSTEITGIESESPEFPPEQNTNGADEPREPGPRRGGGALAFLAVLLALAALAGTGWMWWQGQSESGQESERLASLISGLENRDKEMAANLDRLRSDLGNLSADDSKGEIGTLRKQADADRARLDQLAAAVEQQQALNRTLQAAVSQLNGRMQAAETALAGLANRESGAAGELDIAEVGYLLRLANERLRLFSDPVSADQALAAADAQLAAMDNPIYLGVRQDIAAARRQLSAVTVPDYLDITNRLDAMQQEAIALPFPEEARATAASGEPAVSGWWEKFKGVFSNLVTVRRTTADESQRISLQDKDYIRQGIWLEFESARLALLRQDQEVFRSSLARAKSTMGAWFAPDGSQYKAVMQGINELSAVKIKVAFPDISAPWTSLQLLVSSRAVPAAAAPASAEDRPE